MVYFSPSKTRIDMEGILRSYISLEKSEINRILNLTMIEQHKSEFVGVLKLEMNCFVIKILRAIMNVMIKLFPVNIIIGNSA